MTKQEAAKIANGIANEYAVSAAVNHQDVIYAEKIGAIMYCAAYDAALSGENAEYAARFALCFSSLTS